jgi:hypothetical protein
VWYKRPTHIFCNFIEVKTQFRETVAAADRDCAADGVSGAADNEALKYHQRDATFRAALSDC